MAPAMSRSIRFVNSEAVAAGVMSSATTNIAPTACRGDDYAQRHEAEQKRVEPSDGQPCRLGPRRIEGNVYEAPEEHHHHEARYDYGGDDPPQICRTNRQDRADEQRRQVTGEARPGGEAQHPDGEGAREQDG